MFRPAHCSLFIFFGLRKGKEKLIPLFPFHCNVGTDCLIFESTRPGTKHALQKI